MGDCRAVSQYDSREYHKSCAKTLAFSFHQLTGNAFRPQLVDMSAAGSPADACYVVCGTSQDPRPQLCPQSNLLR